MLNENDLLSIDGIDSVQASFNSSDSGFKDVYKCVVKGKNNAVKVTKVADKTGLDSVGLARLRQEVELLNNLSSPYLPNLGELQVIRFDKDGSTFIIYSEDFIEGSDVCELIENDFFVDPSQIKQLIHDVSSAIKIYWNNERTVHRDVKPANIRYAANTNNFILIDAGIAKVRDRTTITPTGHGSPRTPAYTAPEILKGERNLSFKTDLFCLGIVAYEAATKVHPFYVNGMTVQEIENAIINTEPKPIEDYRSDLSSEQTETIMKMLRKRPHQRPNNLDNIINLGDLQ